MSNTNRDSQGRWSSANVQTHTPSGAANGGAPNIADAPTATRPGAADAASFSGSETPAARGAAFSISDGSADDWGGLSQTDALLNRPAGGKGGGGMGDVGGGANKELIPDSDFEQGFAKLRFGGPDLGREVVEAGMRNHQAQKAGRTAYDASLRTSGYGGPEGPGTHVISAPGGSAYHGADIDPGGIPGPGDYDDGGDDWGGGAPGGGGLGGPRDWSPAGGGLGE